ncbi:hypothetical protein EON65_58620, partial [archaeon]
MTFSYLALSLHDMNKNMRLLRQAMESKLRRELTGLDISFQKEAFDSLHERQKQAMFENAKLKDEVALQGVGIANLSARLARQKIQHDKCMKQLNYLNAKVRGACLYVFYYMISTCLRFYTVIRDERASVGHHAAKECFQQAARVSCISVRVLAVCYIYMFWSYLYLPCNFSECNAEMERLMGERERLLSSLKGSRKKAASILAPTLSQSQSQAIPSPVPSTLHPQV